MVAIGNVQDADEMKIDYLLLVNTIETFPRIFRTEEWIAELLIN